jgi:molecular chaperone DnaJ
MLDHYGTLEIPEDASQDEVKAAYRKLAKKWHPDGNGGDRKAEDKFKEIAAAYEVVGDTDRRSAYDQSRRKRQAPERGAQTEHGVRARRAPRSDPGDAMEAASVKVDLLSAFCGTVVTTEAEALRQCRACGGVGSVHTGHIACPACAGARGLMARMLSGRSFLCGRCSGTGYLKIASVCRGCRGHGVTLSRERLRVEIPPGTPDGEVVTSVLSDGSQVNVRVKVSRKPGMERDGDDLVISRRLTAKRMAKGTSLTVTTVDGGKVRIRVPRGISDGSCLRVRGKGMPRPRGGRGDLIVKISASSSGR